jgi:hypothetical protein
MARTMKKFSAGGAQGRYDRRMADIEKDYAKAMARKTGKAAEVAEAKRQQRIADAKDDLAKRTGADRSATRAAERAAESNLTKTRKYGAPKAVTAEASVSQPKVSDTLGAITAPKSGLATTTKKPVQKPVQKPTDKSKPSAADLARAKAALGASNLPSDQGFSRKSKVLGSSKDTRTETPKTGNRGTSRLATAADPKDTSAAASRARFGAALSYLNPFSYIPKGASFEERAEAARRQARQAEGKAKGGKVMKYAKGGSTSPQPSAADRARSKKHLDELKKLKPTAKEGKVVASANRSEGPGFKKGGSMASCGMKKGGKAKAKPFAATKFGAAMKKKSADTKGRAMMKFAKGGSIDGCAVKGKTKTSMIKMKKGGSC